MKPAVRKRFAALPSLDEANQRAGGPCKICGGDCTFFDVVDFNKSCYQSLYPFGSAGIPVEYVRCGSCGFTFTRFFDDWTPEDFSKFIYNDDYLKVDGEYAGARPAALARTLSEKFRAFKNTRILDYGSGAGILVELMRAAGFSEVTGYDPFSNPARPQGKFDIIFCYEVVEHTPDPNATIADMRGFLAPGGLITVGTGLPPANFGEIRGNWWYVAPRNGHVSIFTSQALEAAAKRCGLVAGFGDMITLSDLPANPRLAALLDKSRPRYSLRLGAPEKGSHLDWHTLEGEGNDRFRWTAGERVRWRVRADYTPPCSISVALPVKIAIDPEFLTGSRILIGDQAVPAVYSDGNLIALIDVPHSGPILEIELETPPLRRPCDISETTDQRRLGLAIGVV